MLFRFVALFRSRQPQSCAFLRLFHQSLIQLLAGFYPQLLQFLRAVHQIAAERRVWIQVVKGEVTINGTKATTSDGLAIWDEQAISVHADSDSEILLFDLPPV